MPDRTRRHGDATAIEQRARIADLLQEAAETHHRVYRITDGGDDDWASWYADWLLDLSELPDVLGTKPIRSHLVHALVQCDWNHTAAETDDPWPEFYAPYLAQHFGAAGLAEGNRT
jgi:hypothetical protein